MLVAGILCGALALAQPRWGFEWREVKRKGVDIFVLLDVSKSMLTEDVRPNRLTQAKFACEDLLSKLEGDRVGQAVAGKVHGKQPDMTELGKQRRPDGGALRHTVEQDNRRATSMREHSHP